jgi:hypothetical protein
MTAAPGPTGIAACDAPDQPQRTPELEALYSSFERTRRSVGGALLAAADPGDTGGLDLFRFWDAPIFEKLDHHHQIARAGR